MQELNHVNVLRLVDVFAKKANVSLVIELCHTDLEVGVFPGPWCCCVVSHGGLCCVCGMWLAILLHIVLVGSCGLWFLCCVVGHVVLG